MKPPPSFAPVYAVALYPGLAKIAREHGYALAVHGSLQRDFDVIAIPWQEVVGKPDAVISQIESEFVLRRVGGDPEQKPHGRTAYTLSVGFGECAVDIQFMPPMRPTRGADDDGLLFGAAPRSPLWDDVRDEHIRLHPTCEACGGENGVQAHHVKPYHLFPAMELDPTNLITLCTGRSSCNCHLTFGHLGNWSHWNPRVREMAAEYLTLRTAASGTKSHEA